MAHPSRKRPKFRDRGTTLRVQRSVPPALVEERPAPTSTGEPALELQPPRVQAVERRPALPALTGLRTLLALTILMFHFTPGRGLTWPAHPRFTLYPIVNIGYVFVSFFF